MMSSDKLTSEQLETVFNQLAPHFLFLRKLHEHLIEIGCKPDEDDELLAAANEAHNAVQRLLMMMGKYLLALASIEPIWNIGRRSRSKAPTNARSRYRRIIDAPIKSVTAATSCSRLPVGAGPEAYDELPQ